MKQIKRRDTVIFFTFYFQNLFDFFMGGDVCGTM